VFFEFPNDVDAAAAVDKSFMLGRSLLIVPTLLPGQTVLNTYIPHDRFYEYPSLAALPHTGKVQFVNDKLVKLKLLLRGGSVVPVREYEAPQTTRSLASAPIQLVIALDESFSATGHIIIDDGDSLDVVEKGLFSRVDWSVSSGTLSSKVSTAGYADALQLKVSEVRVAGLPSKPSNVFVDGRSIEFTFDSSVLTFRVESTLGAIPAISWS
jgi:alpha-glucosidase